MKRRIVLFLTIFVFAVSTNCSGYDKDTYRAFEDYLRDNFQSLPEEGIYVMIPTEICHTCIDNMIAMLKMPVDQRKIKVIFITRSTALANDIISRLPETDVFIDNKYKAVKSGLVAGTHIELFEVKSGGVKKYIYRVNENEWEIKELLQKK